MYIEPPKLDLEAYIANYKGDYSSVLLQRLSTK